MAMVMVAMAMVVVLDEGGDGDRWQRARLHGGRIMQYVLIFIPLMPEIRVAWVA